MSKKTQTGEDYFNSLLMKNREDRNKSMWETETELNTSLPQHYFFPCSTSFLKFLLSAHP